MTTMGILVRVLGVYDLEALGVLIGPSSFALHITATLIVVGATPNHVPLELGGLIKISK
jgi:hypothetical protein